MKTQREKYKSDVSLELKSKDFVFDLLVPVGKEFNVHEWLGSPWRLENGTMFHKRSRNKMKRCVKTKDGSYYYLITRGE